MGSKPNVGSMLVSPGQPTPYKEGEFTSLSATPFVKFTLSDVPPPSALYVGVDDVLLVRVMNSVAGCTVRISYRLLRANDGHVVKGDIFLTPTSDRSINNFEIILTEGYLLSVVAAPAGVGATLGQCFCAVYLFQGPITTGFNSGALISGYLLGNQGLGWPGGPQAKPQEGPGWVHLTGIGNPAAGADFIGTVPTNARWRFEGLVATLTTSAAVANRNVELIIDDGTNAFILGPAASAVTASTVATFAAVQSAPYTSAFVNTLMVHIPAGVILRAGFRVRSLTQNLQAGDQWSGIGICVEEWLDT